MTTTTEASSETRQPVWQFLEQLPSGHRLFRLSQPGGTRDGQLAVADATGRNPSVTTDGALFIDSSRPISMLSWQNRNAVLLPVVDEAGVTTSTPICPPTALHLAAGYGLRLQAAGSQQTYTVTRP